MARKRTDRAATFAWLLVAFVAAGVWCLPQTARAQERVAETVHNLSASGPGRLRASTEAEVCVFCHAPHSSRAQRPTWNRETTVTSYKIYQSSTLDVKANQPTGSSKMCLSCHDGTIALGSVLSRSAQIRMIGGDRVPAGLTNLGTDLSDDHPVSFTYAPGVTATDRQLLSPHALPKDVKLDGEGQVQCTSCHDPHHNKYGNFLVVDNAFGALCTSCHVMDGWSAGSHKHAGNSVSGSQRGDWPYATVAANACRACHRSHTAGGRQRLLIHEAEEENCLDCHDGTVAHTNILAELDKSSGHDPRRYQGVHDPAEGVTGGAHVECTDCHNPHAVQAVGAGAATVSGTGVGPTTTHVPGVSAAGVRTERAQQEYEICLRCHGDAPAPTRQRISRQVQTSNYRLMFSPTNASFHPVVSRSPSSDTVSLVPGLAPGSTIRCTDCHNNNNGPRAGGAGPDGPHGSIYEGLLERNYSVRDDAPESEFEYALCYKCHQRSSILSDRSFPSHRKHIVEERTPCSACHDAHGISSTQSVGSDHTHLMNFDTRIVRPDSVGRRIRFEDRGRFAGSCTLTCHSVEHIDVAYGVGATPRSPRDRTRLRRIRPRR